MGSFNDLFKALGSIPQHADDACKRGLKRGAAIVMGKAKKKLGSYQAGSGSYAAWVKLKPETVRKKHLSKTQAGKLTQAGKKYLRQHGSWGAGGDADAPLVDTGHLRQAITIDDHSLRSSGVVYVGVAAGNKDQGKGNPGDYAAAQEFGYAQKNIPPRPFLRPALHESKDEIREQIKRELQREMRRL
ncbi:HK97 gp10 family phage protein [Brevibacillus sp. HD3.3A]|uniref:HK97 gp10 family phage protein n=1 Tax=Brevibacillus sp. HD3.3A TaxID=2738979 RepID=UPI00156B532D|nr:HK97 gp10 family phage protein [Brevibacillus sp. HD3.3A]UED70691.1 hypothetical protein HP435_08670 [Brevibacillus sp. HD3.3A]